MYTIAQKYGVNKITYVFIEKRKYLCLAKLDIISESFQFADNFEDRVL